MSEQLYLWLCSWAMLGQGLVGITTFGFYQPSWALDSAKLLARWRWNQK